MLGKPWKARMPVHIAVFAAAGLVFYLGLGVGLSRDATAGAVLWGVAGVIALLNLAWIVVAAVISRRRSPE